MALERQVKAKILSKRDVEEEHKAQVWIETVIGEKFPAGLDYEDALRDGIILCKLVNKLMPGAIKINTSGGQFKMMENINNFLKAIESYGVATVDLFPTIDLYEKKDISAVTKCLYALGRTTYRHPEWTGPWLGPKPAEENKRQFDDEVLAAAKTHIGLQAGSNQGATQAGSNLGASRRIIIGK